MTPDIYDYDARVTQKCMTMARKKAKENRQNTQTNKYPHDYDNYNAIGTHDYDAEDTVTQQRRTATMAERDSTTTCARTTMMLHTRTSASGA